MLVTIVGVLLCCGWITASYPDGKTPNIQLTDLDELWQSFQIRFKKNYQLGEEPLRRKIWEENVKFIQRHNLEYDLGIHTYTVGLNEYADLGPEEYKKYLLGFRPVPSNVDFHSGSNVFEYRKAQVQDLPENWDWRKYGYVTPIKNQGQCGSCWAFSSTGSLEGQNFRKTGRLVSLSEQNLVDCCVGTYGNAGCNGGWMMNSFNYIKDNHGIDREDSYPYEARDDTCRYNSQDRGADDTGYVMIPKNDEMALKAAAAKVGPVSVAIDASQQSFQLYRSGVYVEPQCSHNTTDHAVLVVGYGVYNPNQTPKNQFQKTWDKLPENLDVGGQDYWLVKNSWGTSWGMDGYIMMARNLDNQCGIASYACYPTE